MRPTANRHLSRDRKKIGEKPRAACLNNRLRDNFRRRISRRRRCVKQRRKRIVAPVIICLSLKYSKEKAVWAEQVAERTGQREAQNAVKALRSSQKGDRTTPK